MNYWLLVSVLISIGSTATFALIQEKDFNEPMKKISKYLHTKCNLIVGISDEEVAAMREGKFDQFDEKTTERIQGYITCLWIVSDIMSLDLELDLEVLRPYMHEALQKNGPEMYADCLKKGKSSSPKDAHKAVWNMERCVYEADPENFVMY